MSYALAGVVDSSMMNTKCKLETASVYTSDLKDHNVNNKEASFQHWKTIDVPRSVKQLSQFILYVLVIRC